MIFRKYVELVKPGIIFGNGVTALAGMFLAAQGMPNYTLLFGVLVGLSLVVGSACVFNNYIDRKMDEKMVRTRNRPLVTGEISVLAALCFAGLMGIVGEGFLLFFGTPLSAVCALMGFFVYVVPYSFLKYYSVHATLIGSIAGAIPPVVGYTALSGEFDLAILILFTMIVLWQMPHFFAIASYRLAEYQAASIPVLPLKRGMYITKIQMLLYVMAFVLASVSLFFYGYAGYIYLGVSLLLGGWWVGVALQGFKCRQDGIWARKMFLVSLIVVMGQSVAIPL
ncbi:MAG: heme o synthase [Simkaniaceae bacterium]|nr:heme o synthase [Simkaniaceae bacterium]